MKAKLIFFVVMILLTAIVIFVPWLLAAFFQSRIWYLTFIPLAAVFCIVWVKGGIRVL